MCYVNNDSLKTTKVGSVTWCPTEKIEIRLLLFTVHELTVASRQSKNVDQSGDQQMLVLCDLTRVACHGKEEGRSQMIGWDPKTEMAPSSRQRQKKNKKVSCWTGFVRDGTKAQNSG